MPLSIAGFTVKKVYSLYRVRQFGSQNLSSNIMSLPCIEYCCILFWRFCYVFGDSWHNSNKNLQHHRFLTWCFSFSQFSAAITSLTSDFSINPYMVIALRSCSLWCPDFPKFKCNTRLTAISQFILELKLVRVNVTSMINVSSFALFRFVAFLSNTLSQNLNTSTAIFCLLQSGS